jgi:hypothetical protein
LNWYRPLTSTSPMPRPEASNTVSVAEPLRISRPMLVSER